MARTRNGAELRRPHLVLSYVSDEYRVVVHEARNSLNNLLRHDEAFPLLIGKRMFRVHGFDLLTPGRKPGRKILPFRRQLLREQRQ